MFCSYLVVLGLASAHAQENGPSRGPLRFRLHPSLDVPLIIAGGSLIATEAVVRSQRSELPINLLKGLRTVNVPSFDRAVFSMIGDRDAARSQADLIVGSAVAAPLLLGFDPTARREWRTLTALYAEAMALTIGCRISASLIAPRYRPLCYLEEVPLDDRSAVRSSASFFSGHTSTAACATFFAASVIDGLHPELRGKRWLVYGAAAVPPAITAWCRLRSGDHFPSDVITGYLFGAAVGVLVPLLHRTDRAEHLTVRPCAGEGAAGFTMVVRW